MNHKLLFSFLSAICLISLTILPADAKSRSFVKEYVYEAGESDSKLTCRTIALEQVKRLLLDELGTFIVSNSEVVNYQVTKDQVVKYSSGIVMTAIISEKWDGQKYTLKAKVTADPDEVVKSINLLRKDREKTAEIQELHAETAAAMQEIELLKKELASTKMDKQKQDRYLKSVNKLLIEGKIEEGVNLSRQHKYKEAIKPFTDVLTYNPDHYKTLNMRGFAYYKLKKYDTAVKDFDAAIRIKPSYLRPYINKGWTAFDQGRFEDALALFEQTLAYDPEYARGYNSRGFYYFKKGNFGKAKPDFDKAIALNPQYAAAYLDRGRCYYERKEYNNALNDYNKGLEIDPRNAIGYYGRGNTYSKLKQKDKAVADYKIAAELGYGKAEKKLAVQGKK